MSMLFGINLTFPMSYMEEQNNFRVISVQTMLLSSVQVRFFSVCQWWDPRIRNCIRYNQPPPPQLPIPKILFHPLAWGPIKVTIPSSYRWKYAPLWLINHPRRLELDSLFLPWYRQPNHTLYIVFHPSMFRPPPPPGWLATGLLGTPVGR